MDPEVERQVCAGLIRFRIPWAGIVLATLALGGLGMAVAGHELRTDAPVSPLAILLPACGAAFGLGVLLLDRRLLGPERLAASIAVPDVALALRHLLAGHLLLWSLAVIPALLGFAHILLGGALKTHLLLCGVSLGALAYLMPAEARIAARVEEALK